MKTRTKALTLALCAVLLVVATVFATMAFLTSKDSVTNTFTVGNVAITLDEADVDNSNTDTTSEGRDKANKYHLIPGHTYDKDPTIHVTEGSEDCWLFVKVENGLEKAEAEGATSIASQMAANGWALVDGETNIYAYKEIVTAETGKNVVVFESFKIAGNTDVEDFKDANITVTAYAIQADGFDTSAIAWEQAGTEAQGN